MREGKFKRREKPNIGELVIATGNPSKFGRYQSILVENFDVKGTSLKDEELEKIDEPFDTAEANARHKALNYYRQCGKPVLSVDEALYVDFLPSDQQPGVHVRRIGGGEEVSDDELLARVLELVKKAPADKRTGRWHFGICIVRGENDIYETASDAERRFITTPSDRRLPRYPLSSIMVQDEFGKPGSELTPEESARSDALLNAKVAEAVRHAWGIKE